MAACDEKLYENDWHEIVSDCENEVRKRELTMALCWPGRGEVHERAQAPKLNVTGLELQGFLDIQLINNWLHLLHMHPALCLSTYWRD